LYLPLSKRKYKSFELLIGLTGNPSTLKHMNDGGGIETIEQCMVVGTGEPIGRFFLKKYWRKDMDMEQVAELGYFTIKAIMEDKLEYTVGLADASENKEQSKPEIHFIPDGKDDYPASYDYLENCETRVNSRLDNLRKQVF
jgi:20S proteasome alpha/beta subunit